MTRTIIVQDYVLIGEDKFYVGMWWNGHLDHCFAGHTEWFPAFGLDEERFVDTKALPMNWMLAV